MTRTGARKPVSGGVGGPPPPPAPAFAEKRGDECRSGLLGCVACKKDLLSFMEPPFAGFRERRESYKASDVDAILASGASKARAAAQATLDEVRRAMRLK